MIVCLLVTFGPITWAAIVSFRWLLARIEAHAWRHTAPPHDQRVVPVGNEARLRSVAAASVADETGSRDQTGIVPGHPHATNSVVARFPTEPGPGRISVPLTPIERRHTHLPRPATHPAR